MPQLDWNEYEFTECLEVLPTVEEGAVKHRFQVLQPDLTLVLTLWQFESVITIDITRTGLSAPLIAFALVVRGRARHLKGPGTECIEFTNAVIVPSRFSYIDYERKHLNLFDPKQVPGLDAIRLFIKPAMRLEIPRRWQPL